MIETEPLYIAKFKESVEKSINDLAVMIKENVAMKSDLENLVTKDGLEERMEEMRVLNKQDLKEAIDPIIKHIGAYEIRAKNVEDILNKEHKPRIIDLEKEVFKFA